MRIDGFQAGCDACGLKDGEQPDLALIASDRDCAAAAVFTTNSVVAAPVIYDRALLEEHPGARAVVINAGNANACTGARGLEDAKNMAQRAAAAVGCEPGEVLVMSTGVIGVRLPMDRVLPGIDAAATRLRPDGFLEAAGAIMTTDTRPKHSVREAGGVRIGGIAKGAGMIAPNMATMLAVLVTDAEIAAADLEQVLRSSVASSFNRIVVDGDMSTNDTVLLLANGASGVRLQGAALRRFGEVLEELCRELAKAIVADGEGATKFVAVKVTGAADAASAHTVATAIARSPLCKTAFYGSDPNWGRILSAAGASGAVVEPGRMELWLASEDEAARIRLAAGGAAAGFDEAAAHAVMKQDAWVVHLDLGLGEHVAEIWTCDLSPEYVTINSDYRS